jgi:boron transporter
MMSMAASIDWFAGMRSDLKKRLPFYVSDWTDIFGQKVVSSTMFIFFTSIAPAITFSLFVSQTTSNELGAMEILLSTALTGVIFSVLAGQPLIILGVTGPVAILTASIYTLSVAWGVKFIPLYAWSQIWAGLFEILLAVSNSCSLLKFVTQFSCEIFGILIALIYLYTGLEGMAKMLSANEFSFLSGLLQFIIAIGTALTSYWLSNARHWIIFTEDIRNLISDYGATVSIVLWSAVPYLAANRLDSTDHIPKLFVPLQFGTTSGRPWFVDLGDIPPWGIFAAAFPGLIVAVLFFFDHNVSCIIAQHHEYGLKKGTAFHWDFFIVGISNIVTGILGIPPTNGLIPQAPLHVKSLVVKTRIIRDDHVTSEFVIEHVYEQRLSNLLQSILTGLGMIQPFCTALRSIPTAVLYGLFLFLGIQSFEDNEFSSRMLIYFTDASLRFHGSTPSMSRLMKAVPHDLMNRFTAIQAVLCVIIYGTTFTQAGVIFPVLIGMLVIIRQKVLPQFFPEHVMSILDKAVLSAEDQWILSHPGEGPNPNVPTEVIEQDLEQEFEVELDLDMDKESSSSHHSMELTSEIELQEF